MRPTLILAVLATATLGALTVPAGLASAEQSPVETIGLLEAEGYTVNVDRVGSAPLADCVVTSVRNPQTVTKWIRVRDKHDKDGKDDFVLVPVVVSRSISVSLDCSR
ncbi:hypothetical protein [Mycobacterium sp. MMS18-G62]